MNVVQAENTHQLTFVLAQKSCRPAGKQRYRINKTRRLFYRLILIAQRDLLWPRSFSALSVLCCIQGIKSLFQVATMRKDEVLLMSVSQSEGLGFLRLSLEVKSKTETTLTEVRIFLLATGVKILHLWFCFFAFTVFTL